jgi:hypothetical protein
MSTHAATHTEYPYTIGSPEDFKYLWPIEQHGTEEEKMALRTQRKVAGEALRDAEIDIGILEYRNQRAVSELKQLEAELCRVIAARQELERQIEAKLDAESAIEADEMTADSESSLQHVVVGASNSEINQLEAELCRVISARTLLDNQIEEKLATLSLIKSQLEEVIKKREEMFRPK